MHLSLLLGLALTTGAPARKEAPKGATIVGEWAVESAVMGGQAAPAADVQKVRFTFSADGKLTVREGSDKADEGKYVLDPKKDPAHIDLTPPADKKMPPAQGIYHLDGDTLTMCFRRGDQKGAERPTKFDSPKGSDAVLMTLKRVKAKE